MATTFRTPQTPFRFAEILDTASRLRGWSHDQIRSNLRMSGHDFRRLHDAWVDDMAADRYAGRLNMHPSEIWADWDIVLQELAVELFDDFDDTADVVAPPRRLELEPVHDWDAELAALTVDPSEQLGLFDAPLRRLELEPAE